MRKKDETDLVCALQQLIEPPLLNVQMPDPCSSRWNKSGANDRFSRSFYNLLVRVERMPKLS
jgi:hypothetical protein